MNDLCDHATLIEVLSPGTEERRIRRALDLYQRGVGSLGYVAELVGISKRVLLEEGRRRGVLPQPDESFAEQDLNR